MNAQFAEYSLLVPRRFNSHHHVPAKQRRRIERLAVRRFRGFTALRGLDGAWPDRGHLFRERNDEYRVAAPARDTVLAFAREVGALLEQRAVYVRCPDGTVLIVPIDHDRRV
jgi:hypothetical protein